MKYKVGQKVRVRKDLEAEIEYGNFYFNYDMEKMRGKIVTIERKNENHYELKNHYEIKEDNNVWCWTDEMLEPVEDIIEYKGKKYDVLDKINRHCICSEADFPPRKSVSEEHDELILTLKEHKEEILDEAEKRYLRAVIRPFRDKVNSILKSDNMIGYFIAINTYGSLNNVWLPEFKDKRMYKGMELDKKYSLEELGL